LIASGVRLALGAPCFFDSPGEGDSGGEFSGVAVGDGVSLGDVDLSGVSVASGVGEDFFFRCGDPLGEGELFFFFAAGVGDSISSVGDGLFFFLGEDAGDGSGDFSSLGEGDVFFFGEAMGLGVGDVFFALEDFFFFRGVGVGVGVEKIFLMACPSDSSAPRTGRTGSDIKTNATNKRISMTKTLTDAAAFLLDADFGSIVDVRATQLSASLETAAMINSPA
jgi:hypothetical protein